MHPEIIMAITPSHPDAKPAPFRIFDMQKESHWNYLLSGETLWFEAMIDMQNMLLALHHRCFCDVNTEVDLTLFKVSTLGSVTRFILFKGRLEWFVVEIRNCTAKMIGVYESRQEAEKHC